MRVVRLEPGHRWHETFITLPDGTQYYLEPVLVQPVRIDWNEVGVQLLDHSLETVQWSVERLVPRLAAWYGVEYGLIGPKMSLRELKRRRKPNPGVW